MYVDEKDLLLGCILIKFVDLVIRLVRLVLIVLGEVIF